MEKAVQLESMKVSHRIELVGARFSHAHDLGNKKDIPS
jgi:hypothetical protein